MLIDIITQYVVSTVIVMLVDVLLTLGSLCLIIEVLRSDWEGYKIAMQCCRILTSTQRGVLLKFPMISQEIHGY